MSYKLIENEVRRIEELAYRRGVAHGLQVGLSIPEDPNELERKIEEWRHDLTNKNGIPGTRFENVKMYFDEY